jgi:2-polyprenyl-3-methyl-5-hydroxy-6-metoxy-1,4-benzoquinol methylase
VPAIRLLTPLRPKDWLHDRINGQPADASAYRRQWEPRLALKPTLLNPLSQACTADQIYLPRYRQWVDEMNQPYVVHRKQWEWVYICQALEKAGCLVTGKRGLGFGVGTEPITAIAAKRGCTVLATDANFDQAEAGGWVDTNQHANDLSSLNTLGICDPDVFNQRVSFQVVDMRHVPESLERDFDFAWSACALEHLGDIEAGFDFIRRSLACLRPGGTAVHTTEYNVSSNDATIETGSTVLYRRCDFERFAKELRAAGHRMQITYGLGTTEDDRHIDEMPYTNCHLKVRHEGFVITSFGLIITKAN